jgi:uncharacterized protein (TIGR00725 family)
VTEAEHQLAFRCGALLAGRGATVLNGGLGGVMAATAAGVKSAGGACIALLPGDSDNGNDDVTFALTTGLGEMRNALIARCAQAIIAIGGGWGTLSEIALARRLGRPVALLESWQLRAPGGDHVTASLHHAKSADEAVEWVMSRVTRS